jgi:hypothetical protein
MADPVLEQYPPRHLLHSLWLEGESRWADRDRIVEEMRPARDASSLPVLEALAVEEQEGSEQQEALIARLP